MAERAREFGGDLGVRGHDRLLGQDREEGGAVLRAGQGVESALDDAVLERVEGDHDEPRALRGEADRPLDEGAEPFELLVDLDAEGLEGLGRGMDAAPLRPPLVDPFDEDPEVAGRLEPAELAQVGDLAGQPAGLGELAVLREHLGQLLFRVGVQDLRGRRLHPPVHAHVQRPFVHVAEAPLGGIQLEGRDAEVDEDAPDLLEGDVEIGEVLEVGLKERDPLGVGREPLPGDLEGLARRGPGRSGGPGDSSRGAIRA